MRQKCFAHRVHWAAACVLVLLPVYLVLVLGGDIGQSPSKTVCFASAGAQPAAHITQTAPTAVEITKTCTYEGSKSYQDTANLHDRKFGSYWSSRADNASIQIDAPQGQLIASLYICFRKFPNAWGIDTATPQGITRVYSGENAYLHAYVTVPQPCQQITLAADAGALTVSELRVFAAGAPPQDVQLWQPLPAKTDLMVLVAHPDDEFVFFGGTIPWYAAAMGKRVAVVYMSATNPGRRHELLNGLWTAGLRYYPVMGTFPDVFVKTLKGAYRYWKPDAVDQFIAALIYNYKPDVLVTHDIHGEYGHGAHRLCADASIRVILTLAQKGGYPDLAQAYGVWNVQKLYLHLYKTNPIKMNWRVPIASLGGQTALEVARAAFLCHRSQQGIPYTVTDRGALSGASFGLYYTSVGADLVGGDFFEHTAR